jgi:hypothetical protein
MTTPSLALPELGASQAQKHVTVNEALNALDVLVQLAVIDRGLAAPPDAPAEGQRWLVASGESGASNGCPPGRSQASLVEARCRLR